MLTLIVDESTSNNWIRSRGEPGNFTWNEVQDGVNLTVAPTEYNDLTIGQHNDVANNRLKVYEGFGEFSLVNIPEGARIQSISMRSDVNYDPGDGDFTAELYKFDWGSSVSTFDWRSRAQLSALRTGGDQLGSMVVSTPQLGWRSWAVDADLVDLVQTAFDNGDTSFKYVYASRDTRLGNSTNSGNEELIGLDLSGTQTEWTINYIIPRLSAIMNGCIA